MKVKQIIALRMDVVIFGRVSTLIQDYDRQINELTAICTQRGWLVRSVFTEKISGAKKNAERKELSRMIEYIKAQHIDKVLVTELSRLGRDTLQVLQVIETLNDMNVSLYIQNYNIETLNEDGKVNAMSQFLITILAEIARMERKTIRERMNSGYKNFREQWKSRARLTPEGKATVTPENLLFLTPLKS